MGDLQALAREHLRLPGVTVGGEPRGDDADALVAWLGAGLQEGERLVATARYDRGPGVLGAARVRLLQVSGGGVSGALVTDRRLAWIDGYRSVTVGWDQLRGAAEGGDPFSRWLTVRTAGGAVVVNTPFPGAWAAFVTAALQGPRDPGPELRVETEHELQLRALVDASPDREFLLPGLRLLERAISAGRPMNAGWWETSVDPSALAALAAARFGPELVAQDAGAGTWVYRRRVASAPLPVDVRLTARAGDTHVEYRLDRPHDGDRRPDPAALAALHADLLAREASLLARRAAFGVELSTAAVAALTDEEVAARVGTAASALRTPLRPAPPVERRAGPALSDETPRGIAFAAVLQIVGGVAGAMAAIAVGLVLMGLGGHVTELEERSRPDFELGPPLVLVGLVLVAMGWIPGILRVMLGVAAAILPSHAQAPLRSAALVGLLSGFLGDPVGVLAAVPTWFAARSAVGAPGMRPPPPFPVALAAAVQMVSAIAGVVVAPATCLGAALALIPLSDALERRRDPAYGPVTLVAVYLILATLVAWAPAALRCVVALLPLVAPRARLALRVGMLVGLSSIIVGDVLGLLAGTVSAALLLTGSARRWDPDAQ